MADISRDKEKKNVDVKATSVEDLKLLQVDNIAWYDVHGAWYDIYKETPWLTANTKMINSVYLKSENKCLNKLKFRHLRCHLGFLKSWIFQFQIWFKGPICDTVQNFVEILAKPLWILLSHDLATTTKLSIGTVSVCVYVFVFVCEGFRAAGRRIHATFVTMMLRKITRWNTPTEWFVASVPGNK